MTFALTKSLSRITAVGLTALLCALTASTTFAQGAPSALIDEYIQKSGFSRQLESLAPNVIGQITESLAGGNELSPESRGRIEAAAKKVFTSTRVQAQVRTQLGKVANAADLREAIVFYDSSLGKRVVDVEVAAAKRDPEAEQQRAMVLAQSFEKSQPERYALAKRIEAATRGTEFVVGLMENSMVAMLAGASATSGDSRKFEIDAVRKQMRDGDSAVRGQLRPLMIAAIGVMYEPLSDDDFKQYAQMLEKPTFGRLSDTVLRAMDAMFVELAKEIGKTLGAKWT